MSTTFAKADNYNFAGKIIDYTAPIGLSFSYLIISGRVTPKFILPANFEVMSTEWTLEHKI